MRTRTLAAALGGAALVATLSEWMSYDSTDKPAVLVADGAVGFVILASAVLVWRRRPSTPLALVMGLAGTTWFAGSVWPSLAHLHRGPLVHLHVSYPTGRLRWWPATALVAVAYVVSGAQPFGADEEATIALSAVVAIVATGQYARTTGTARRAGLPALFAAWTFAGVLGLAAVGRRSGWRSDTTLLWTYYVAIVVAVTVLLVDFVRARWSDAVVTDLVIDLARRPGTDTLRAALGRALGDPSLVLAYPVGGDGGYVDDVGLPVDVSTPGEGRVATAITRDGVPLAVLVHDAAVLDDPVLVEQVAAGAALAVSNARLQARARERVDELVASRRRLVEAGDAQRRRFGRELDETVQTRLARIAELVGDLDGMPDLPAPLVRELVRDVEATREELDDVARGLLPRALSAGGLASALPSLATRLAGSAELSVDVTTDRLPPRVEATVYFLCAEALANAAKHAAASRISIAVASAAGGSVTTTVVDDGVGGADVARGTGLLGLVDRVEAVGGRLAIDSPPGAGTRLSASIPL